MLASHALWPLLLWLSTHWLTAQATEPDCTHVADFDNCPDNDLFDFCPRGIACGCKDQQPFCKCPYYQSGWQNYWYLGAKCDQLWSTLDFIIIIVLPAITLSVTTAVAFQWVNYCKSKPSKTAKRHSTPAQKLTHHRQQSRADVPSSPDKARHVSQPLGRKDDGNPQNYKFPRLPAPSHVYEETQAPRFGGFRENQSPPSRQAALLRRQQSHLRSTPGPHSYNPHQPLRRAAPMGANAFMDPTPQDSWHSYVESEIPDADYEEETPFPTIAMQQLQTSSHSLFPRPSYKSDYH